MARSTPRSTKTAGKTYKDDSSAELQTPGVATDEPPPQLKNAPQSAAVDAIFQNDKSLGQAITKNLTTLRAESKEVADRVEQAWKFSPSQLSPEELARRHYVAPGADPAEMLEAVMIEGVDAIRSSKSETSITLQNSGDLKRLIKMNDRSGRGSLYGTIGLEPLVNFITSKQNAQSALAADPTYTICKAEVEAQKVLDIVEKAPESDNGGGEPGMGDSSSENRDVDLLVKDAVNLQMKSAKAPEAQLQYSSIPNSADKDKVQSGILQTFQLRPGASDVTSYHDFNTLQIAFAHVWTQIFDGQLDSLGRELYHEYVKLKDFTGSADPDLTISTLADLKRLIEEVKSLTVFTEGAIPGDGKGSGNNQERSPKTPKDLKEDFKNFLPDPASRLTFEFIDRMITDLSTAGQKPRLNWKSFPGPLPNRADQIEVRIEENLAPQGFVEIRLDWSNGNLWKGIDYQEFDSTSNRFVSIAKISNNNSDRDLWNPNSPHMLTLATYRVSSGLLEFDSQEVVGGVPVQGEGGKRGRYLLGDLSEKLVDRTRVTFKWLVG